MMSVNGAGGRMGRAVLRLLAERGVVVAEALVEGGSALAGKDAWSLVGQEGLREPLPIATTHAAGDVMIDFSTPEGFRVRLAQCVARGTAFVSGTTGLHSGDMKLLRDASAKIPVIHAPNFSMGIALLAKITREAAKVFPNYDCEITEIHHRMKRDAPSGTALRLLDAVQQGLEDSGQKSRRDVHGRQGDVGARPRSEIGLHAVRGGDIVGDHTVYFLGEGERIELTHRATSRDAFASGAVRCAMALCGRPAGTYTVDGLILGGE